MQIHRSVNQKNNILRLMAGAIAHELRGPLATISLSTQILERKLAELDKLVNKKDSLDDIRNEVDCIRNRVKASNEFINFTLENMKDLNANSNSLSLISIKDCVDKVINNYSFLGKEKDLLNVDIKKDFKFKGSMHVIEHSLINLLQNALFFISLKGSGQIYIWTETKGKNNLLHFKDTGPGISEDHIKYIFEGFFTKRQGGTGIGLAFCKELLRQIGGDITCESKEGEYTHFILSFPKIEK